MSVDQRTLEVKSREGSGKGAARRLRAEGLVPAVVYGKHLEKPLAIAVNAKAVRQAINTPHKFNTLLTLKGAGDQLVLFKDYQQDPVTRDMLHVDFIAVREQEQVKVNVPLVLVGRAAGVAEGGLLTQVRRELEVYAMPRSIPEKIEADVTHLNITDVLHVNDLKLPEGVKVKSTVNYTIAVLSAPEGAVEAAPAAAAAVAGAAAAKPAAGAAAKPAAGAAAKPAAGAAAKPAAGAKK
jgi:large subunit ribosomal protein L25